MSSTVETAASQQRNSLLTLIYNVLKSGVLIQPNLPNFTVASLPATAANGQLAFASNARKPGEGAGAGTGSIVYFNGATSTWFTTLNVVVTS
jgi:hypothetical protein